MRTRVMIGAAALCLASATFAGAQDKPQTTAAAGSTGTIEIGGRFTSTSGDEARYQRYQDLRNGANVNLLYSRETPNWTFDLKARNIGYRDQNYVAGFNSRRVRLSFVFDQTPLNYMYGALTPYNCTAGNCSLDAALRAQVQAARGTRIVNGNYSPNNNQTIAVGVPQNLLQLQAGSIYNRIAQSFDLQQRRDTIAANAIISATDNVNLLLGVQTFKKSGQMPWGASFAFPNGVEVPLVVDNRTTDVTAAVEWASHQGTMRMGYSHSKFNQSIPSFTFDNPLFATPWSGTPNTGYDPSGYSSAAGGAAFGRMALAPSNTMNTFDWLGMIKLPGRTTANASFMMSANRQNEQLIPWTANPVVASPSVYAAFPELAHLPRETANLKVNYATGTFNVTSRPVRMVSLNARYRYNNRTDVARPFHAIEYVRFDAVPEETGGIAEPFQITRNTLDLNAAFTPIPYSAIRVGYTLDRYDHWERPTQGWKDNTFRVSFDTVGNQWVTLRAIYERSQRDAIDTDIEDITGAGGQPALRFYDEASRNRDRGSFIVELNPMASVGVNFTLSAGKDDFKGADSTMEFGLWDNSNTSWSVGANYTPSAKVNLGADYGRETYKALQQSRNANPAPDASWTNPQRSWTLDQEDAVNFASVYLNLVEAIAKTDIRFGYDFSDSDQGFLFGGPRVDPSVAGSLAALGQFIQPPNVTNSWNRATVDLRYAISPKVGVGFGYYYEKFDVSDWATINTAGPQSLPVAVLGQQTDRPRMDYLGALITGYGNRPYKGQTGFVRLFYMF